MPAFATMAPTKPLGLTITPATVQITVDPGTPATRALTVTNNTKNAVTVSLVAEQFNVTDVDYDYSFSAPTDVTKWVSFNTNNFILGASQSQQVVYTLAAPKTAEPGGKYLSLFAQTSQGQASGITTVSRVGELLYITVAGKASQTGSLDKLTTPRFISQNTKWQALISDKGTLHFDSRWRVTLQSVFGGVVTATTGDSLILPKTTKAVNGDMPLPEGPGIYKATFTIGLGDTPAAGGSIYVFYIPMWLRWALLGIAASLVGILLRWLVPRYKRRS